MPALAGRADFLYLAASSLCWYDSMRYMHGVGGRSVSVMPRSRQEDAQFREWYQTRTSAWALVWDRPNPRYRDGPRDRWHVFKPTLPSKEVRPITNGAHDSCCAISLADSAASAPPSKNWRHCTGG